MEIKFFIYNTKWHEQRKRETIIFENSQRQSLRPQGKYQNCPSEKLVGDRFEMCSHVFKPQFAIYIYSKYSQYALTDIFYLI